MVPPHVGPYLGAAAFTEAWQSFAHAHGRASVAGHSVLGRPIHRFEFGARSGPTILLTALLHGVEVIGSVALLRTLERLFEAKDHALGRLREHARIVVVPIANPDAFAENMDRLARGRLAFRRGNARGVDLNRNFPHVGHAEPSHPFSGSKRPWSPHYVGPHPLSEAESRALVALADEIQPDVAVGYHSFGNMLLYPWAHTEAPNPRASTYQRLGARFSGALRGAPYQVGQATQLYPTLGDLDDWLDARHGTLAFTVEVGDLDRRLLHPRRMVNPFCWMNPSSSASIERAVDDLAPAVHALLTRATHLDREPAPSRLSSAPKPLPVAAR
jgi:predicted deacylase